MTEGYSSFIFDLDGTLVDSAGDIFACLRAAFSAAGLDPASVKPDKAALALPLKDLVLSVRQETDESSMRAICVKFRELYDSSDYASTRLYPGVEDLLRSLQEDKSQLFVATNKPALPTCRLLRKFGIFQLFSDTISPDVLPGKKFTKAQMLATLAEKWKLNSSRTLMVGDSDADIRAAAENGMPAAYLLSGYGEDAKALALQPAFILPDISGLRKVRGSTGTCKASGRERT